MRSTSRRIRPRKSAATSGSDKAPDSRVSTMTLMEAIGLRSSWETLLTNSFWLVSTWRMRVKSCRVSKTPGTLLSSRGVAMALKCRRVWSMATSPCCRVCSVWHWVTKRWISWSLTSSMSREPSGSSRCRFSSSRAARLSSSTRPPGSVTITPSAIVASTADRVLRSSESCCTVARRESAMALKAAASCPVSSAAGAAAR